MRVHPYQVVFPLLLLALIYALAVAARASFPLLYASAITLLLWKACRNMDVSLRRRAAARKAGVTQT